MPHALPTDRARLRDIAHRAMNEHGLLPEFSPAALAEATAAPSTVSESGPSIRDLRGMPWASIDNDDSLDLDQLSVAEPLPDGRVRILVAVADVDAAVPSGSAIDEHARTNTTSVYTAAELFPMLPERLSTNLTSLVESQDRLAIVVAMVVGQDGEVVDPHGAASDSDVYRAIVKNHAKLAYNSVAAWLEGSGPMPPRVAAVPGLDAQIRLQDKVALLMRGLRHQHGALSLETVESRAVFDGDLISGLRPEEKNRAKELIEDFMIAANGVTAKFLDRHKFASIRRVLRSPDRWGRIVQLAADHGERLPAQPNASALQGFLRSQRSKDAAAFPDVSLSVVKLLGSGSYAVEQSGEKPDGHFGLAVGDYTHSTAPNRRFPDLATQRLLKAAIEGQPPPYTFQELTTLAAHCTLQEDNATKVERQVRKSAAALFLASRIGQRFDGIVTGASPKGTWVRTLGTPVEGRVVQGFDGLDVGDRVRVCLVHIDVERGFIDFARQR